MASFTEEDLSPKAEDKSTMAAAFAQALGRLIGAGASIGPVRGVFGPSSGPVQNMAESADAALPSNPPALTDPEPARSDRSSGAMAAAQADSMPPPPPVAPTSQYGMFTPKNGAGGASIPPVAQPVSNPSGPGLPPQAPPTPMKNYIDQFNSKMTLADAFKLGAIPLGTTILGGLMGGNRGALSGAVEGFKAIEGEKKKPGDVNKNRFEPIKTINPKTGRAEYVFFDREKGSVVSADGLPIYDFNIWNRQGDSPQAGGDVSPAPTEPGSGTARSAPPADNPASPAAVTPNNQTKPAAGQPPKLPGGKGGSMVMPNDAADKLSNTYADLIGQYEDAKNEAHADANDKQRQNESPKMADDRRKRGAQQELEIGKEILGLKKANIADAHKIEQEDKTFQNKKDFADYENKLVTDREAKLAKLRANLSSNAGTYTDDKGITRKGIPQEDGTILRSSNDPPVASRKTGSSNDKANKAYKDMIHAELVPSSRSAVGQTYTDLLSIEKANQLLQRPDLNKLSSTEVSLARDEIAKIALGGVPSDSARHEVDTPTYQSAWQSFMSKFQNKPNGAQLGDFLRQNKRYLDELAAVSQRRKNDYIIGNFKGTRPSLTPELVDTWKADHPDLAPLIDKPVSSSAQAPRSTAPAKKKFKSMPGQTLMRTLKGDVINVPNANVGRAKQENKWETLGPDEVQ